MRRTPWFVAALVVIALAVPTAAAARPARFEDPLAPRAASARTIGADNSPDWVDAVVVLGVFVSICSWVAIQSRGGATVRVARPPRAEPYLIDPGRPDPDR